MAGRSRWLQLLPAPVRRLPADLAAVIALVGVTAAVVFLPVVSETPLRVVFGLPFVLFVPGYAFIAALFPEAGTFETSYDAAHDEVAAPNDRSGIDGIERVALSFGLSIAVVPLIGLVLNFTPWGIRLVPIMVAVSLFTLASTAVAARRRWALDPEDRLTVPWREWLGEARAELFEPESRADAALNVLLVASVLLAVGSVGYAVAVPQQGEAFTEFYLLTENEDGELVADDYPTEFTQGESESLVVGIGNHEHQSETYSVVVALQDVRIENTSGNTVNDSDGGGNISIAVEEEEELRRFQTQVAHNGTWHLQHNVTPTMTGEQLRLTYLLYKGEAPEDPTVENAYRELHLWVNVSDP
ncbi:DUF1616 domain-containing protein [Halolamina sp. CBA1230]|uniref:DUF1616 domain-containing protein n=1 Tax=Halolamina sp. CBA1230 TaxID=1853690 RepID=UPI0009A2543C|nr:DUF1616 domain-containing protein [Halolamina sp. CBA1230]QKY20485.1 DUF1616 domain-containing protein [Halolamina sp. CBA1230]